MEPHSPDVTELPYGFCPCGAPGEWLLWDKTVRIGTFACSMHRAAVKKYYGGGPVENMTYEEQQP